MNKKVDLISFDSSCEANLRKLSPEKAMEILCKHGTIVTREHHAYNVKLLNAGDLFDTCEPISKQSSIAPNASLEVKVTFIQNLVAHSGMDADALPRIPADKNNHDLLIQYENERGTKLLTKFA